jgi:UDP-GlcNAc3NAcA epimerase
MKNLQNEGIPSEQMHLVGDVMYDACLFYRERARKPDWFDKLGAKMGDFVLATVHRAKNTDDPARLAAILTGLAGAGRPVILPVHPRTRKRIEALALGPLPGLHLLPPVGYLEMVWLEKNCAVVATDSGGVQKEAYFHGKPCVTLRDETEWVELVEIGWNRLVGIETGRITRAFDSIKEPHDKQPRLFGEGNAANAVLVCLQQFGGCNRVIKLS